MDETRLPLSAASARTGRDFVHAFCRAHGIPGSTEDDAILIVSELIGNAYLHARSGTRLRLSYQQKVLRVEVADGSHIEPVLASAGPTDDDGRGVLIMDALAHRWGVRPQVDGKVVWFELGQ